MSRAAGFFSALALIVVAVVLTASASARQFTHDGEIEVLFPPDDDLGAAVMREISQTKEEALVFAYSFTHRKITEALIALHRRGVTVRVLADVSRKKEKNNRAQQLARHGIEVIYGPARRSWHNKVMVFDGHTVITGSANFTHSAQWYNRENVVIIHDNPAIAAHYRDYWHKLAKEAGEGK